MDRSLLKWLLSAILLVVMLTFTRFIPEERLNDKVLRLTDKRTDPDFLQAPAAWVDSVLDTLTLEQKIGQLIMVAAYSNNNRRNETEITDLIRQYNIGGLVFFQGSPYKQAQLTNFYQSISNTPLLIGMDAENGLAMRLDSTIRYPSQMMLGAIENDHLIYEMGMQIASQMKRLGAHINFAPVVDINNNPDNPVINRRSFGEDIVTVSRKSLFYMVGLGNGGILAVAKHFPGHGDTKTDSHRELPVLYHSLERLDSLELFPFRELIYNGLPGIMTAHLHIPALDPRLSLPSSLSEIVIDSLLQGKMGFKGLVFTDALSMKGITNHYKPVEAALLALRAGNDVLLMPEEIPDIIKEIAKMVRNGKLSGDIIDAHCRKILAAKYWAGLHHYCPVELANLTNDLNKPEYVLLQRKLTGSSITLLQNKNHILPLKSLDTLRIASVVFSTGDDSVFQQTLGLYMPVHTFRITGDGSDKTDSIFRELKKYNLIIASIHGNTVTPVNQYGITDCMMDLADSLSADHAVILDVFANPYVLARLKNQDRLKAIVMSYENSDLVQSLSAQALFGAIGLSGTLPVSSVPWRSNKSGIRMESSGRLAFTIPGEANMSEDTLRKIDLIVQKAIDVQAMPGCQVLVARNGKVVLNKAYGRFTYSKGSREVTTSDLYDLASVTKAAATTQAIMHLVDDGCVGLNQKLSAYLPYLEKTNKKDIRVADVLLHQSGLLPSIQLYNATLEPVFKNTPLLTSVISDNNPLKVGPGQYMNRFTDFRSEIISEKQTLAFPYQVADHMYISKSWPDSMFAVIAGSTLQVKKEKEYVYSDLGFILFKQMVDSITLFPFDQLLDSLFYSRLGAENLCFNPLKKFNREIIAPTEDDKVFRQQLIQGYVHDQRAAMFGGIAGHAGLFGNALDVAKLFQMLLDDGEYAGERYISKETVETFTRKKYGTNGNRRGLGFDKPETDLTKPGPACLSATPESFGHTGFTGTMVWVDPAYDLVYVFLSNRVYPDASNNKLVEMNIRTQIQQVIYNSVTDRKQ